VFTRRAVALRDREWLARLQRLVPQGSGGATNHSLT
jgi:hypothetical protein